MTLIIGTLCSDGIVMGADGAATLGELGQKTICQPVKKLDIVDTKIVTGISGPVGLGQIIRGEIESLWSKEKLKNKKPYEAMLTLQEKIRPHLLNELSAAKIAGATLGIVAINSAISHTLVAIPIKKELCLFQFNQQGLAEQATKNLPFVAIGSGQTIADPFLAFIRRIFWKESLPNVEQGKFAVQWTLEHAIKTAPEGISEPIQIVELRKEDSDLVASEISQDNLKEGLEAISDIEKYISNFSNIIEETTPEKIPEP